MEDLIDSTYKTTSNFNILIVEDEEAVRTISAYALKDQGYKILEANNGLEAIKLIEEGLTKIDLILTDVIMPELNGPDLIEKVRSLNANVKVVFISGYSEEHSAIRDFSKTNRIHFLSKPFTIKELTNKVKEVLML